MKNEKSLKERTVAMHPTAVETVIKDELLCHLVTQEPLDSFQAHFIYNVLASVTYTNHTLHKDQHKKSHALCKIINMDL
jgi:hypothetical protein